jgi:hypothetical protein
MQGDLCDRPERNARPFEDGSSRGPFEDGIISNSNNNHLDPLGDSIFESSSASAENEKSFFTRFFDLFGGVIDDMCPVNTNYPFSDSPFMDKLCDMLGFCIPESGGVYHCTDPSMMVPPSPFIPDLSDFCSNS